jgi:hypothetical protein
MRYTARSNTGIGAPKQRSSVERSSGPSERFIRSML